MIIAVFLNTLGLGGTAKAVCRWAAGLRVRGHKVTALSLADGPRRAEFESAGVRLQIVPAQAPAMAQARRELAPDVIHGHAPGFPHEGDLLGVILALLPAKIPLVRSDRPSGKFFLKCNRLLV